MVRLAPARRCLTRTTKPSTARPEVGSCGTAAFHDKTVAVYDIATNPLWANFKDLDGKVLGTFANYYRVVRDPSPKDEELTELITHAAANAIEHDRAAVSAG